MRRKKTFAILFGILAVFFLIFFWSGIWRFFSDPSGVAFGSISGKLYSVSINFKKVFSGSAVSGVIEENQKLTVENARLLELQEENNSLRQELKFVEQYKYPVVTSRIIGKMKENGITFFILNRGEDSNISIGSPVVVNGFLVGKIMRVHKTTSAIVPLAAPSIKTAATLAGSEQTTGIVEGELNTSLILNFIPKELEISIGMPVITSGLEEKIPRGLVIGKIERIEDGAHELFKSAYLKTPVQLSDINIVSVISGNL